MFPLFRPVRPDPGSHDLVPVWLREIPDAVLLSDLYLDQWLAVLRLPMPAPEHLATERKFRRLRKAVIA